MPASPNRCRTGAAPFPVPIADQHTLADQHIVIRRPHEAHDLTHEHVIEMGVDLRMWTRREARSMRKSDTPLRQRRMATILPIESLGTYSTNCQFEIRLDSLQLAPFEYDHLFYEPRGSRGERLAVGRYLIGDQGDVLVPFLGDECKNV